MRISQRMDVRLTMGGEPTFVSIDDPDGEEWNTAALGPDKRRLAANSFIDCKINTRRTGLRISGKASGIPASSCRAGRSTVSGGAMASRCGSTRNCSRTSALDYGATAASAQTFSGRGRGATGPVDQTMFPAYEDAFYYLWRERRLPVERRSVRFAARGSAGTSTTRDVFSAGSRQRGRLCVADCARRCRRTLAHRPLVPAARTLLSAPGDSPLGLRLPLDSQPWVAQGDYPYVHPPDPTQTLAAARAHTQRSGGKIARGERERPSACAVESRQRSRCAAPRRNLRIGCTRTAMCAEARNGVLYMFMPPASALEDYLEMRQRRGRRGASAQSQPVVLEGYEPPSDPRLNSFRVTPDPGVIEVNIHPSSSWDELVASHDASVRGSAAVAAHAPRSSCSMGVTPERAAAITSCSAARRRRFALPAAAGSAAQSDLVLAQPSGAVVSVLRLVHRADARRRRVSMKRATIRCTNSSSRSSSSRRRSSACPPWLVDRLLRNLLIDVTGNTHRAEFCIDKMYLARRTRPVASDCSSCARSRCRRTRA